MSRGITRSDSLVVTMIDPSLLVGAGFEVMDRDARQMRRFGFTNLKSGSGVDEVIGFVIREGGL